MKLPVFKKRKETTAKPFDFEIYWTRRRMWIAVTWGVIVASSAVAYYFFVALPEEHKQFIELQKQEQALRERIENAKLEQERSFRDAEIEAKKYDDLKLDSCLSNAENAYVGGWDQECADRGLGRDCRLPNAAAAELNGAFKAAREECFTRFKTI